VGLWHGACSIPTMTNYLLKLHALKHRLLAGAIESGRWLVTVLLIESYRRSSKTRSVPCSLSLLTVTPTCQPTRIASCSMQRAEGRTWRLSISLPSVRTKTQYVVQHGMPQMLCNKPPLQRRQRFSHGPRPYLRKHNIVVLVRGVASNADHMRVPGLGCRGRRDLLVTQIADWDLKRRINGERLCVKPQCHFDSVE
jgi:hypothetical protein